MSDENVVAPQPSPTPSPSQGMNWKNIIIGVIIGAVLFGGGGYLVYNAYQPKKAEHKPQLLQRQPHLQLLRKKNPKTKRRIGRLT